MWATVFLASMIVGFASMVVNFIKVAVVLRKSDDVRSKELAADIYILLCVLSFLVMYGSCFALVGMALAEVM